MNVSGSSPTITPHEHSWQPNGTVVEDRLLLSPVSVYDHQKQRVTYSIMVCECGATKRTVVGADAARFVNRGRAGVTVV